MEDKSLEDRQESFFLSETCKYLYLLFDTENPIHGKEGEKFLFTTEGHIFPISSKIREKVWKDDFFDEDNFFEEYPSANEKIRYSSSAFSVSSSEHSRTLRNGDNVYDARLSSDNVSHSSSDDFFPSSLSKPKCQSPGTDSPFRLPLKSKYLAGRIYSGGTPGVAQSERWFNKSKLLHNVWNRQLLAQQTLTP